MDCLSLTCTLLLALVALSNGASLLSRLESQLRNGSPPQFEQAKRAKLSPSQRGRLLKFSGVLNEEMTVPLFGTLKISCKSTAVPAPVIHWMKDYKRIYQNPSIDELVANGESSYRAGITTAATESVYTETCMRTSAIYTCVSETPTDKIIHTVHVHVEEEEGPVIPDHCKSVLEQDVRKQHSFAVEDNMSTVPEQPQIYMWTYIVRAAIGSQLQVYCRAKGVHPSSVRWSIRGRTDPGFVDITPENEEKYGFRQLPNGDLKTDSLIPTGPPHTGFFNLRCSVGNKSFGDTKTLFVSISADRSKPDSV